MPLDLSTVRAHTDDVWLHAAEPTLRDYIRIPNVSPNFDPDWQERGHMARATELLRAWAADRPVAGLRAEVIQLPGRTPLLLLDVPPFGSSDDPAPDVLLYGHLDKQPPMEGWRPGLGPWEPVVEDGRLFGRGGADDGYSLFAALTAIEAVQAAGGRHRRCVVLIEASEESGSPDLPAYVDHLADRLGRPDLVVALDSGCGDYERLWISTSLRGVLVGALRVDVLAEGVHSGVSSGAPDSFRIIRRLLDRVEDATTGRILVPELHVDLPQERGDQLATTAAVLGDDPAFDLPLLDGVDSEVDTVTELLRRRTWTPTLTVLGADGLPPGRTAGAVLRPWTEVTLSFRLPPTCDPAVAARAVTDALTADPPYHARVRFDVLGTMAGWDAPPTARWLAAATAEASLATFGAPPCGLGIGGSIPFMAMLGERFPDAQFLVTGVLGPGSNAHGPNEFLDLATARNLTASVAIVLDRHSQRARAAPQRSPR